MEIETKEFLSFRLADHPEGKSCTLITSMELHKISSQMKTERFNVNNGK